MDKLDLTLEQLIDKHTLSIVLNAMSSVCDQKADHLVSNWQDENAARAWTAAAGHIDEAISEIDELGLP